MSEGTSKDKLHFREASLNKGQLVERTLQQGINNSLVNTENKEQTEWTYYLTGLAILRKRKVRHIYSYLALNYSYLVILMCWTQKCNIANEYWYRLILYSTARQWANITDEWTVLERGFHADSSRKFLRCCQSRMSPFAAQHIQLSDRVELNFVNTAV